MRRAAFAFVGVATLAVLIFIVFQSWSVMTRLKDMPSGELSVAAPDESAAAAPVRELVESEEKPSEVAAPLPPAPEEPGADKPPVTPPDAAWAAPVQYTDVQLPGWRRDPHGAFWYYDAATVLEAPPGSPVMAAGPGVVAATAPAAGGGWNVDVLHDDGYVTRYGNVFQLAVATGDPVSAYASLGVVGPAAGNGTQSSGTGAGLSFTAWRAGEAVDAVALFSSGP